MSKKYYSEFFISLELYGHLLSLATRPLSEGNDIAVKEAKNAINACIDQLSLGDYLIISDKQIEMIKNLLAISDVIPLQNIARTVISSLHQILKFQKQESSHWPVLYKTNFKKNDNLQKIVISIGPTIGLGDEFILAKALTRRAKQCNISIHVETRRFELWNCFDCHVQYIGKPPTATFDYLNSLSSEELRKTGYIYADFLTSDPTDIPLYMPEHLAFSGRWIFGNASGIFVDPRIKRVFSFRYPQDMPLSRKMQCDWMAGKFCINVYPEASKSTSGNLNVVINHGKEKNILLQVLTSKPQLIFNSDFYLQCFNDLQNLTGKKFIVTVLAGPTERSRKITNSVYNTLRTSLPTSRVVKLQPANLSGVLETVKNADLLFGPDTFTSHIAAMFGVPQVTIHLPEHHAWINSASQGFFLSLNGQKQDLAAAAVRRIAFLLGRYQRLSDSPMFELSQSWKRNFRQLGTIIRQYMYGISTVDPNEISRVVMQISLILKRSEWIMEKSLGIKHSYIEEQYSKLNLDVHFSKEESGSIQKIACWYHNLGSTDLSGVLFCLS